MGFSNNNHQKILKSIANSWESWKTYSNSHDVHIKINQSSNHPPKEINQNQNSNIPRTNKHMLSAITQFTNFKQKITICLIPRGENELTGSRVHGGKESHQSRECRRGSPPSHNPIQRTTSCKPSEKRIPPLPSNPTTLQEKKKMNFVKANQKSLWIHKDTRRGKHPNVSPSPAVLVIKGNCMVFYT